MGADFQACILGGRLPRRPGRRDAGKMPALRQERGAAVPGASWIAGLWRHLESADFQADLRSIEILGETITLGDTSVPQLELFHPN